MKIPGGGEIRLGVYSDHHPTGGALADRTPPPPRASIIDDGVEFEPVWFPHRNARSLLGEGVSRPSTLAVPICDAELEGLDLSLEGGDVA